MQARSGFSWAYGGVFRLQTPEALGSAWLWGGCGKSRDHVLFSEPLPHPAGGRPRCPCPPGPARPWQFPSGTGWWNKGLRQEGLCQQSHQHRQTFGRPKEAGGEQRGPRPYQPARSAPTRKQLSAPTFPVSCKQRPSRPPRNTPTPGTTKPSGPAGSWLGGHDQKDNGHLLVLLLDLHPSIPTPSVLLWGAPHFLSRLLTGSTPIAPRPQAPGGAEGLPWG